MYAPLPNPFAPTLFDGPDGPVLPAPTPTELQEMTLHEWYDAQGRRVYARMQAEMERELRAFEDRVELGRHELRRMIEVAKRREDKERDVGLKPVRRV
jgi:hypothetical protein